MLITDIRHEIPALPFMWSPEARQWRAVSLVSRKPYFFVSYSNRKVDAQLFQASLIANDEDLLRFCADVNGNSTWQIHQFTMLLPDAENVNGSWRMLFVKEIWSGVVGSDDTATAVLVGINGEMCSGSQFISNVDRVKLVDIKYQLN